MSDKIDINEVALVIKQHKLDPATVREILEELNARIQDKEDEKGEPTPRQKTQYVALIADANGHLKKFEAFTGWVVQIPEEASPLSALDRIMKAAHDFNASKKGHLLPCKTVGEALESAGRKWFKNAGVSVKTKLPIYFLTTDNKLTEAPTA